MREPLPSNKWLSPQCCQFFGRSGAYGVAQPPTFQPLNPGVWQQGVGGSAAVAGSSGVAVPGYGAQWAVQYPSRPTYAGTTKSRQTGYEGIHLPAFAWLAVSRYTCGEFCTAD